MTGKRSQYGTADFKRAQFAYHEDGRIGMRSGRWPVDPWEGSDGIHRSDTGMNKEGFRPLPNLADALIAQQQTMQASLDEAIREVSERVWGEGYNSGFGVASARIMGGATGDVENPYRRATP